MLNSIFTNFTTLVRYGPLLLNGLLAQAYGACLTTWLYPKVYSANLDIIRKFGHFINLLKI